MRITSFLAGALCGALVGAAAALLLAPASGAELRGEARERFEGIVADARKAAADKRAELEARLEALKRPSQPPVASISE